MLIRHLWQLNAVVFLHWSLIHAVLLEVHWIHNWSYAQIIFLAGFARQGTINKDSTVWLDGRPSNYEDDELILQDILLISLLIKSLQLLCNWVITEKLTKSPGANIIKLFSPKFKYFWIKLERLSMVSPSSLGCHLWAKARSLPYNVAPQRFFNRVGSCFTNRH